MGGVDWQRRTWTTIFVVTTFVSQIWSCSAYHNSYNKWAKEHPSWHTVNLEDLVQKFIPVPSDDSSTGRHLRENYSQLSKAIPNGWRTSLVDEGHKFHLKHNLTSMERIRRDAERSRSRAQYLNSRTRASNFHGSSGTPGRKTLQAAPTSFYTITGSTGGEYSMVISIGTPAQTFIAIADTGSDLVWLQCSGCTVCFPQPNPYFDPSNSSTYTLLGCTAACSLLGNNEQTCTPNCQYSYSYGDKSTTQGDFSTDVLILSDLNNKEESISGLLFGCGYQNQGTFVDTDGLVGLGRGPISFPSQLAPLLSNSQKFSYCLVSRGSNSSVVSPIIFGEAAVPSGVLSYTPLLTPNDVTQVPFYYVSLAGITVGSTLLNIPVTAFDVDATGSGGTIFDSGTTYIILTAEAFTAVGNAFISALPYTQVDLSTQIGLQVCFDITGVQSVSVPKLIFHFENADMDLPYLNYIVVAAESGSQYMCIAIISGDMNILGNIMQQNYLMLYEEDNKQIGFASVDCSTV